MSQRCHAILNFSVRKFLLASLLLAGGQPSAAFASTNSETAEEAGSNAYADRLIEGGDLAPIVLMDDGANRRSSGGNSRSLVIELGGSRTSSLSRTSGEVGSEFSQTYQEFGLNISGTYQTDNWGLLRLETVLHTGSRGSRLPSKTTRPTIGLLKVSSDGVPIGNGWLANVTAGTTTAPAIPLLISQPRFYIPRSPIVGGTMTLVQYARLGKAGETSQTEPVSSINLAVGQPGIYGGFQYGGFSGLSGLSVSAGGQTAVTKNLVAGFQAISVQKSQDPNQAIIQDIAAADARAPSRRSSQAVMGTIGYQQGALALYGNAIWSHRSSGLTETLGPSRSANAAGLAMDGIYQAGRSMHRGGFYYYAPDLSWGSEMVMNNVVGGYYRFSATSQRWQWNVNIDGVDTISGRGSRGVMLSADARHQLTFGVNLGARAAARIANGDKSGQLQVFVDFTNPLGTTRAEAGYGRERQHQSYRLGWDQTWNLPDWLPPTSRLSTQLGLEHSVQTNAASMPGNRAAPGKSTRFSATLRGGGTPFNAVTFDAAVSYKSDVSANADALFGMAASTFAASSNPTSQAGQSFSANFNAAIRLSPEWSLNASFSDTSSSLRARYGLAATNYSPIGMTGSDLLEERQNSFRVRAGFFTIRYSLSAGRSRNSIGVGEYPVGGTGTLEGRVFLDANKDGRQNAEERSAPGVTVTLDGRVTAKADDTGFYRFENVVDGPHQITATSDTLPLPWHLVSPRSLQDVNRFSAVIDVGVRDTVVFDIAAVRD